ncbi:DNA polymerase III, delta-prime subunit [Syntrophotalea carbinolica DSM 2380]|uniref:DNA polymerase III subunit delta' n=1 Tax=Syntrophotalea carbinolica (strain DSM 2380 / NBRC 103641 / GraBd1) TaxID=338963 RepID=Q3A3X2_SYNC1|nr:DNA polymerase III subunit delta' [Syntrophotalea carbinolica]ABA88935.1 DNA polymerase III, delta-prime subunit [Syntrophotalea carbinolica DSM 2380]
MFSRVLGHQRQKDLLEKAVSSKRLPHAYLFEGPEGIGKRLVALALTKILFCANGNSCGDCPACHKVDHHNHPDLHQLGPDGSSIKIEQIRALQKELSYRPLEAPYKVSIIDGAEKMNPAAANALLKTLEEPRSQTLLILLTPAPDAVLPTIRSRCQRLPFSRIPRERLQEVLVEQLNIEDAQAHILATLSEGSFKKALGKDRELYLQRRKELLKNLTALSSGSIIPLLNLAQKFAEEKDLLFDILEIIQAFYRDLLLLQHGRPMDDLVNVDMLETLQSVSRRENVSSLLGKLDALMTSRRHLERNVNRQLAMEVLLLRLVA